ncbi:hypothetical protein [Pseudoalteromonas maricaloris]|uniref:hypothetical protein n=2 Tax=Pseudoalteromonas TaxID=53246 RepID=UPI00029B0B22|nr:hypothetical protein [Pseudoalteromonas flavipulchra]
MKVSLISGAITFALGVISASAKVQASDDVERIEVNGWKHERECVINVRSMRQARCFSGGWGGTSGGVSGGMGVAASGGESSDASKTESELDEAAVDLTVAAKQLLNALEELRARARKNSILVRKIEKKIDAINLLIAAGGQGLQGIAHAIKGENGEAISEALTLVVGAAAGTSIGKAAILVKRASHSKKFAIRIAEIIGSYHVGAAFEEHMDNLLQQELNIPNNWSNPPQHYEGPETVTDIVCSMMSVVHRPDEPPCRGYRSLDTLAASGHFIVLDLAQDGVEWSLNPNTNSITVGSADALLIVDANQNNQLDSASEILFRPFTETQDTISLLDSNQDAILDKLDNNYHYLKVWQDANHNGVIDVGEVIAAADKSLTIYLDEMSAGNRNQQGRMDVEGTEYAISVIRIGFKHE